MRSLIVGKPSSSGTELGQIASHIFFKDGKKNIILIFEVVVKGATRLARAQSNVFDAGMFEAVLRKDMPGGANKLAARDDATALPLDSPFFRLDHSFCIRHTLS